jgi:molybdopterin molybdotransferase
MISVKKALELVLEQTRNFGVEQVSLLGSSGRVLAEPVLADRDFPPFDRVTMDGIAINYDSFRQGQQRYKIENIHAAGSPVITLGNHENCIEVMTGAVLPVNTDVVIPYEQCEISNGVATLNVEKINKYQNIHKAGSDAKEGVVLVDKYEKITPAVAAILASVGRSFVDVLRLPRVAICSTGEELVDIEQTPETHQVRRSNLYAIAAALVPLGIDVTIDHLPDEPGQMKTQVTQLMEHNDVMLFSGAVSKGKFDYLPQVLSDLGMQTVFHKVAQKPGKPLLFGTFSNGPVVFGFPGNPASTFACFHLFFVPWLRSALHSKTKELSAILKREIIFKPNLDYHLLVETSIEDGCIHALPVENTNSGDMVALVKAAGLITLPAERDIFYKDEVFIFTSFSNNYL